MVVISPLQVDLSTISTYASLLSSVAIILGAGFVVYQIRQDDKLLRVSVRQADANAEQAQLTLKQLTQNSDFATLDLVMRMYEFADSTEVQRSFLTVLSTNIKSFEEYESLPEEKKLAYLQIVSLFESLGFLVEKNFVKAEIIDDMFATNLTWDSTEPFIKGMRKKYASEDFYFFFERLHKRLSGNDTGSITATYLQKLSDGKSTHGRPGETRVDQEQAPP